MISTIVVCMFLAIQDKTTLYYPPKSPLNCESSSLNIDSKTFRLAAKVKFFGFFSGSN